MTLYLDNGEEITLREWQNASVIRSRRPVQGIFLEARGGRGKTIGALAICQDKKAKRVLILNNKKAILEGWKSDCERIDLGYQVYYEFRTDKWLRHKADAIREVKKQLASMRKKIGKHKLYRKNEEYVALFDKFKAMEQELKFDILVIDEWQDMCSDSICKNYLLIQRDYTIGLSATPIRQKGENFYPLEKTFFNSQEPSQRAVWRLTWGEMQYDGYSATKTKWVKFLDYEKYITQLDNRTNFMRWEEIEYLENAKENNGYLLKTFKKRVPIPENNLERMKFYRTYNVIEDNGEFFMGKGFMSNKHVERLLKQAEIKIDNHKVVVDRSRTSPLMEMVGGLLERSLYRTTGLFGGVIVVCESKAVAEVIYERYKGEQLGLWVGERQENHLSAVNLVATAKAMGVGVDGLQYRFDTMVVLDPKEEDSGEYNDYRQLKWRISGARQQHEVNIIELYYDE